VCTETTPNEPENCITAEQPDLTVHRQALPTFPDVCRNDAQFKAWQRSRDWLMYDANEKTVRCSTCSQIKRLGLFNESGQHNETAFIDVVVQCKTAKSLLKKIDKHRDSNAHKSCALTVCTRSAETIVQSIKAAETKFKERHRDNIDVTMKVFRTAYECTKSHLPCTEHARLIELQSLNGLNCGNILYSNHTCSNVISHISSEMRSEIVQHIVNSGAPFSVMVDESTSVANAQSLIVKL